MALENCLREDTREGYSLNYLAKVFKFNSSDYKTIDITLSSLHLENPEPEGDNYLNAMIERTSLLQEILPSWATYQSFLEGCKNAQLHGNNNDPNKEALVYYRENEDSIEILIEDEGQEYSSNFLNWLEDSEKLLDKNDPIKCFYNSTDSERPNFDYSCGGRGIPMMVGSFDEVGYYKSPNGGTILRLYLEKNKETA
jgi:anti-sigma regulatory factor (Ser/Thr protein kinase)